MLAQFDGEFAGLFVFVGLIGVVGLAVMIWALVDAIKVPDDSMYRAGSKLVWVLVIIFLGTIGAIIYFAVGRPSRETRQMGQPGQMPPSV